MPPRPDRGAATRDKLLFHLKTKGPQTASRLARRLGVTPVAARQHLERLSAEGLVASEEGRARVGRPARVWRLAAAGHERFPEGYAELTVGLLDAMREAFGERALAKLVEARTAAQLAAYSERVPQGRRVPLARRVAALAELRTEEGYMAEWTEHADGSLTLVESHCPICAAAEVCQGLCANELELFRRLLGDGVEVERTEHLFDGARRCAYRITPRKRARAARRR